jgi:hypothetical protein
VPKWVDCPFYMYDKDNYIKCEGGKKVFEEREDLLQFLECICGNVITYKQCDIAVAMNRKWEEILDGKAQKDQPV